MDKDTFNYVSISEIPYGCLDEDDVEKLYRFSERNETITLQLGVRGGQISVVSMFFN